VALHVTAVLCGKSFFNFTTETQSITEFAQRNALSDRLTRRLIYFATGPRASLD
jgi:hypothetical protein